MPEREIRATFDEKTIRVYQAYGDAIADSALERGTFVSPPFKMDRMTWIKPSFLWMMYRSGWGTKPGQERILAIEITRDGFEWALSHSCLSDFSPSLYSSPEEWQELKKQSPVRIQWDPERGLDLEKLNYRSLQLGLSGEASKRYVAEWIQNIHDMTGMVHQIRSNRDLILELIQKERAYPLPEQLARRIGITSNIESL